MVSYSKCFPSPDTHFQTSARHALAGKPGKHLLNAFNQIPGKWVFVTGHTWRCWFASLIRTCCDISRLCDRYSESEKKTTLDQALRSVLGDLIVSTLSETCLCKCLKSFHLKAWRVCFDLQVEQKASCDDYLSLIYLSIDAVTDGSLPLTLKVPPDA